MATIRLYVKECLEYEEAKRLGLPRQWYDQYYQFENVNELEPALWLPVDGVNAIKDRITKVTVLIDEPWVREVGYKKDADRYCLGSAQCMVKVHEASIGGVHAYVLCTSTLQVHGDTVQSVLELIFAMKRGEAVKVGDPTFVEYAKQYDIPYSALKKGWKQRLQDWWKGIKVRFLNWIKPLPIPRDVVND